MSCTGGVTSDGKWIRLFPVPYRFLDDDKRFKKYQWIDVDVTKAQDDPRPESYKLNIEKITTGSLIPTDDAWRARKELVFPLKRESLCQIERERQEAGSPTLGIFKPGEIKRLMIKETNHDWSLQQSAILNQQFFDFANAPQKSLEKIPYDFRYEFNCSDPYCKGHRMICTDWEMGESYRRWRKDYGDSWEEKFRQRYEEEMIHKYDTHFYVGTVHQHPGTWIIVGLFYPPTESTPDLFDITPN